MFVRVAARPFLVRVIQVKCKNVDIFQFFGDFFQNVEVFFKIWRSFLKCGKVFQNLVKFFKMWRSFSRFLRRYSKDLGWASRLKNLRVFTPHLKIQKKNWWSVLQSIIKWGFAPFLAPSKKFKWDFSHLLQKMHLLNGKKT